MPELPEVETIKRSLKRRLKGKTIRKVEILPDSQGVRLLRRFPSRAAFTRRLAGRSIKDLRRRAKYLLFYLEGGEILILHLGMSGQLLLLPLRIPLPPHTRMVLHLSEGVRLCFVDPRKFGEAYLFSEKTGEKRVNPFLLGPEPLGKEFTPKKLAEILQRRKATVKSVLLDQKAVAGLGNIYCDEALFRARIHPARNSSTLDKKEIALLHRAIRDILREAVGLRGTTAADRQYVDARGRAGGFQESLRVYQRKGEDCHRCRETIRTTKISGRTTHFCPACQSPDK